MKLYLGRIGLLVVVAGGAACSEDTVAKLRGHLSAPPLLDFGEVQVGATLTLPLEVTNDGQATLTDVQVVRAASFEAATHIFAVKPSSLALIPNEAKPLAVSFTALSATDTPVESSFQVVSRELTTVDDLPVSVTVQVRGRGIPLGLTLDPNPVDFGAVLVGAHRDLTITITNHETMPIVLHTPRDATGKAVIDRAVGVGRFEIVSPIGTDGSLAGTGMGIPPGGSISVVARYTPEASLTVGSQDRGRWLLSRCTEGQCDVPLPFMGRAVTGAVSCEPELLAFGLVNPETTLTRTVRCANVADEPVELTRWALEQGSATEFELGPLPALPARLDPGTGLDIPLRFHPTQVTLAGGMEKSANLVVNSRAVSPTRALADVRIALTGEAGGPTIVVQPSALSFGQVAVGTTLVRRLVVENAGYHPLAVHDVQFLDPAFSALERAFTLNPQEARIIDVSYSPMTIGAVTSSVVITSDDVGHPAISVRLSGEGVALPPCQYALSPAQVGFGIVILPHAANQAVRIDNLGTSECLVRDVEITGSGDFYLNEARTTDFRIPAGGFHTIGLRYSPVQAGTASGELGFYISDPSRTHPSVPLHGTAQRTGLLVSPDQIRFGQVEPGCATGARTINVYNLDGAAATIDRVEVVDALSPTPFQLNGLPLPAQLGAGQATSFTASFRPLAPTPERDAYVHLFANGQTDPYVVALYGSTAVDPINQEHFTQADTAKVDILFVVDNSCSMQGFQTSLATNFASFIQEAVAQAYDYQMAVVTTDVGDDSFPPLDCRSLPAQRPALMAQGKCGYFADGDPLGIRSDPSWRIITSATLPSPIEAFQAIAVQGSMGAGIERGLEGAFNALSPPKIDGWNAGFLRPDASLAIVVVSDDDDDADDIPNPPPDWRTFYLNYFRSIKGFADPTRFSFSAIVSPPDASYGQTCFTEDLGVVYTQYAEATGGIVASICPGVDWSVSLAALGQSVFGYRAQFNLLNNPDLATLTVTVNGVLIAPTSPNGTVYWSYDSASNSVRFRPASIPEPGSKIVITYAPVCI